jgi:predicted DNA-binding ribbon-helix-helix protein
MRKPITISLEEKLIEKIKEIAKAKKRTITSICDEILSAGIKKTRV